MKIDGMVITDLGTSFKSSYQRGYASKEQLYSRVATIVPSSSGSNTYAWLGDFDGMREWLGARLIKELSKHGYTITNKQFELTIGVKATDIKDDNVGIYTPRFIGMGESAASHPDELVFGLLKSGFEQDCYDGQPFFDHDHPTEVNGTEDVYSNMQDGAGEPWYLLDTSRHLKPLIWQPREAAEFESKEDSSNSDYVFNNDKYLYGIDARYNAGFGFPQMAFASKADLTAANVKLNRSKMTRLKDTKDKPMGIRPNLLVVGTSNEDAADEIVGQKMINGSNNPLYGKFEVLVVPWLD